MILLRMSSSFFSTCNDANLGGSPAAAQKQRLSHVKATVFSRHRHDPTGQRQPMQEGVHTSPGVLSSSSATTRCFSADNCIMHGAK